MNYALHAEAIVDGLGKNYAKLQAVVEICQLFVSKLSTVIDSTNQILIPGAGIMERRHQWNVYRLPRVPLASLTQSRSSLAEFFFQTSLGACSQAKFFGVVVCDVKSRQRKEYVFVAENSQRKKTKLKILGRILSLYCIG